MKNKDNALNGKDFINIGIFTAIYMVIVIVIACTVGLVPIGFILLPIIIPIIGGIPMMMYFAKVKKFGMILIFEVLFGIVMILTGMGYTNDAALLAYSLILAINRPIEMLVTSLNVVGDSTTSIVVAKYENQFDEDTYNKEI
mgnify:CR=1 FL=1